MDKARCKTAGERTIAGMEYLRPLVQTVLDSKEKEGAKDSFSTELMDKLSAMSKEEVFEIGRNLVALEQSASILLATVSLVALTKLTQENQS